MWEKLNSSEMSMRLPRSSVNVIVHCLARYLLVHSMNKFPIPVLKCTLCSLHEPSSEMKPQRIPYLH